MSQEDFLNKLLNKASQKNVENFLNQGRAAGQRINEVLHSPEAREALQRVNEAGQPIDLPGLGGKARETAGSAVDILSGTDLSPVEEEARKAAEAGAQRAQELDINEVIRTTRENLEEMQRRSVEGAQHQVDIYERERNGEMPDLHAPAPDNNEVEHPDSPPRRGLFEEAHDFEQDRPVLFPKNNRPFESINWFLDLQRANFVNFPMRPGSQIEPLISSKDVFESVAHAIKNATQSVDIITWGLETDMRLIRSDAEYYHTERYISGARQVDTTWYGGAVMDKHMGFYPAAQHPTPPFDYWMTDAGSRPSNPAAAPDENSWVFADMITAAGKRGVKVNILVWEPSVFAHNYYDPLHFWFRCKTGLVPNVQFAFRKYDGIRCLKPARPNRIKTADGVKVYRNGSQDVVEAAADRLLNDQFLFNFLYSHHQKEVLIDIGDTDKAVGFIIGCNTKEEYWDEPDHKARYGRRRPYRPWRDLGVRVRGPVLADLYKNVEQSWEQMHLSGSNYGGSGRMSNAEDNADIPEYGENRAESETERPLGTTIQMRLGAYTNEVFPAGLIADALAAGITEGLDVSNGGVLRRFNTEKYKFTRANAVMKPSSPVQWNYRLAPQCMELCAILTTIMELIDGLLRGEFETDGMLSQASPDSLWYHRTPENYKTDEGKPKIPAQFLRTFHLQHAPKDLSIRAAYLRALKSAAHQGFIYVENQYFRDPFFAQAVVDLYEQGIKPYLLVVTNRLSTPDGKFVMQENIPGEEPTYFVQELLKESSVNINTCWMHVIECGEKESPPIPAYSGARSMDLVPATLTYLQVLAADGDALPNLYARLLELRTYLFTQIAPYLLYDDLQNGRVPGQRLTERELTLMEGMDERTAPRVAQAVKDFELIKKSFDPLKQMFQFPEFQALMDLINETARDVAVDVFDANIGRYQTEIETAVDKLLAVFGVVKTGMEGRITQKVKSLRFEWLRRKIPFYSFFADIFGSRPEFTIDEHSRQILEMMAYYDPQRRPLALEKEEADKMKRGDIYVHSKAMIVDGVFGIVGSANLNERSMWHDTEVAISFRDSEQKGTTKQMLWDLMKIGLNGEMPEKWSGQEIHKHIKDALKRNDEIYGKEGKPSANLEIHLLTLKPKQRAAGFYGLS